MEEIWKDVIWYEGSYQVSNIGRVKSLPRIVWNGFRWHKLKGRILKQALDTKGYFSVVLSLKGKVKTRSIHQLVA